jgi:hypothetical protein
MSTKGFSMTAAEVEAHEAKVARMKTEAEARRAALGLASGALVAPVGDPAPVPRVTSAEAVKTLLVVRETKDEAKLNKTEKAWWQILKARHAKGELAWIGCQNIALKLGDDCRYNPDFFGIEGGQLVAWEVKGFWRDDAKVKIKTAARLFPWVQFVVVQRVKGGGWRTETVNT